MYYSTASLDFIGKHQVVDKKSKSPLGLHFSSIFLNLFTCYFMVFKIQPPKKYIFDLHIDIFIYLLVLFYENLTNVITFIPYKILNSVFHFLCILLTFASKTPEIP